MEQSSIILINQQQYKLSALLALSKTLPTVTLASKEIIDPEVFYPAPGVELDDHPIPVLFKVNGKYTVIAGRNKVNSGMRDCKIISTVVLKKARKQ